MLLQFSRCKNNKSSQQKDDERDRRGVGCFNGTGSICWLKKLLAPNNRRRLAELIGRSLAGQVGTDEQIVINCQLFGIIVETRGESCGDDWNTRAEISSSGGET